MKSIGVSKAIWRELNKIRREHGFKYYNGAIKYLLKQSTDKQPSMSESDFKQPNKEENKKEHEEKQPLSISKIRGITRFIADKYYNGQYTMEKYTKFQYRFGFGIVESGDIHMFVGKTLTEAMYNAINFESASKIKPTLRDGLTKLADNQSGIIRNERQKNKKLEIELAARDAKYAEIMTEKDNKIVAKEKKCADLTKKSGDLEVLTGEQATIIKDNKEKIKELQDKLALKESENAALAKENKENKAYIKIQDEVTEQLQREVNVKEEENAVLTKEKVVKPEGGLELGRQVDRISKRPIYENPRDEFIKIFCDGKWHSHLDSIGMFRKYDRYNRFKQTGMNPLIHAYMRSIQKFYQKTKRYENGEYNFKFEKKPELGEGKIAKDEEPSEDGIELGMIVDHIDSHSIHKNPLDDAIALFCDGKYHHNSEMIEMFRKYKIYNQLKQSSLVRLIYAYKAHIRKFYQMTKAHGKFKFEKKGIEEKGLPLGKGIGRVGNDIIRENPWNEFERVFCDGKEHPYSKPTEMLRKYEGYNQYTLKSLRVKRGIYFRHAYKYYRKERPHGRKAFRFLPIEERGEEQIEEKGLPLGKKIGCVGRSKIFENPWNEFERVFCDGNEHLYSEPNEMFVKYERYDQYTLGGICSLRVIYFRHACKYYRKERPHGHKTFKFLPIEKPVEEN